MTIETLRTEFREVRKTIPFTYQQGWSEYQDRLLELDTPPTPIEWVQQIRKYAEESRLSSAKGRWESLRSSNPVGWGEDLSLSQIVGWSEDLPIPYQIALIEKQIREDLKVQLDYEDWEDRGR
jgi:hypothetical protein